jgi:hypothetical protein
MNGSTVPAQVRGVQDRSKNARFVAPATLLHFSNVRAHKYHSKFITKFIPQQWQPPSGPLFIDSKVPDATVS